MSLHYSAARNSFFDSAIHAELPADAVPITAARHRELMAGQTEGKCIVPDSKGRPRLARRPALPLEQQREAALRRVRAEARRRIIEVANLEQQSNDNAAIAMMALQLTAGASTIDAFEAVARRERIDAIRAASDRLQAAIASMDAKQLSALGVAAAEHWPA
jgi:hypothetical protein